MKYISPELNINGCPISYGNIQHHEMEGEWKLSIGIHRGTLMSRDSEDPKTRKSLKECFDEAIEAFKWYSRLGCQCWFCYALSPKGERITLIESQPYS